MKASTSYLLIFVLACTLTACGSKPEKTSSGEQTSEPAAEKAAEQAADAPEPEAAETAQNNAEKAPQEAPAMPRAPQVNAQPVRVEYAVQGVECTERMCQCGETACAKNEVCKDGQCYCGNEAVGSDENYQCRIVNTAAIPSTAEKLEKQYLCQSAEGCKCEGPVGETVCPQNSYCISGGGCGCGSTKLSDDNADIPAYACSLMSDNQYDWVCRESNGCRCGSITAAVNMGCNGKSATCLGSPVPGRGLACRAKAYNNYKYHLACFKDECDCYGRTIKKDEICEPLVCANGFARASNGCVCGGESYDDGYECVPGKGGKSVKYCTASGDGACACGETTCQEFEVCKRGECVDRISMKKQENTENYTFKSGFWECTNPDGCTCGKPAKNGKPNCQQGKYCINGSCRKDTYFRTLAGKVLYYRLENHTQNSGYTLHNLWSLMFISEDEPICQDKWMNIYLNIDGRQTALCSDDQYRNMTVEEFLKNCGLGIQPENVGSLYCELSYDYLKDAQGNSTSDVGLFASGWKE